MGPDCKSWPGVTKEGVAPSFRIKLDDATTEDMGSEYGIIELKSILGSLENGGAMALISGTVVNGDTNGKLLLRDDVERA